MFKNIKNFIIIAVLLLTAWIIPILLQEHTDAKTEKKQTTQNTTSSNTSSNTSHTTSKKDNEPSLDSIKIRVGNKIKEATVDDNPDMLLMDSIQNSLSKSGINISTMFIKQVDIKSIDSTSGYVRFYIKTDDIGVDWNTPQLREQKYDALIRLYNKMDEWTKYEIQVTESNRTYTLQVDFVYFYNESLHSLMLEDGFSFIELKHDDYHGFYFIGREGGNSCRKLYCYRDAQGRYHEDSYTPSSSSSSSQSSHHSSSSDYYDFDDFYEDTYGDYEDEDEAYEEWDRLYN